jgi:hypothetical protein
MLWDCVINSQTQLCDLHRLPCWQKAICSLTLPLVEHQGLVCPHSEHSRHWMTPEPAQFGRYCALGNRLGSKPICSLWITTFTFRSQRTELKIERWAGKMARQIKMPAAKPENLEGKNQLLKVVLCDNTYIHAHILLKEQNIFIRFICSVCVCVCVCTRTFM